MVFYLINKISIGQSIILANKKVLVWKMEGLVMLTKMQSGPWF